MSCSSLLFLVLHAAFAYSYRLSVTSPVTAITKYNEPHPEGPFLSVGNFVTLSLCRLRSVGR
jgi:hypothetical protein